MAKRFIVRDLERKYGDLHKVIPALVNEHGQDGAARRLGMNPSTLTSRLKALGIKRTRAA